MTQKEMAAHIRGRIKAAGINARVRMIESCGSKYIQVNAPTFDARFTDEQQRTIRTIAKVNHLTMVRGGEIDIERMTNPASFDFQFNG